MQTRERDAVSRFRRPEHRLVLECSPRLTTGEVVASKQRIEDLVAKRFG